MNKDKVVKALKSIIGFLLLFCVFVAGLGFAGFVVGLIIGGDGAASLCNWLSKSFYPVLIKTSTITTCLCFVLLYVSGKVPWHNPFKKK